MLYFFDKVFFLLFKTGNNCGKNLRLTGKMSKKRGVGAKNPPLSFFPESGGFFHFICFIFPVCGCSLFIFSLLCNAALSCFYCQCDVFRQSISHYLNFACTDIFRIDSSCTGDGCNPAVHRVEFYCLCCHSRCPGYF